MGVYNVKPKHMVHLKEARLIVKRCTHEFGIDFQETLSSLIQEATAQLHKQSRDKQIFQQGNVLDSFST